MWQRGNNNTRLSNGQLCCHASLAFDSTPKATYSSPTRLQQYHAAEM